MMDDSDTLFSTLDAIKQGVDRFRGTLAILKNNIPFRIGQVVQPSTAGRGAEQRKGRKPEGSGRRNG